MGAAISLMEYVQIIVEWFRQNRRRVATAAVGVLAVALGWHVIFGANGMLAYQQKRAEFRKLQVELQNLQSENDQLQQQVEKLRSDPKAIEREAREQLRYARKGEIIYTIPTAAPKEQIPEVTAEKR